LNTDCSIVSKLALILSTMSQANCWCIARASPIYAGLATWCHTP